MKAYFIISAALFAGIAKIAISIIKEKQESMGVIAAIREICIAVLTAACAAWGFYLAFNL